MFVTYQRFRPQSFHNVPKFCLDQLRLRPGEGKPLQRELEGYKSFRIGKFRIIYRVTTKEIEVVAVGPRRTIYEETKRLMKKDADVSSG